MCLVFCICCRRSEHVCIMGSEWVFVLCDLGALGIEVLLWWASEVRCISIHFMGKRYRLEVEVTMVWELLGRILPTNFEMLIILLKKYVFLTNSSLTVRF